MFKLKKCSNSLLVYLCFVKVGVRNNIIITLNYLDWPTNMIKGRILVDQEASYNAKSQIY